MTEQQDQELQKALLALEKAVFECKYENYSEAEPLLIEALKVFQGRPSKEAATCYLHLSEIYSSWGRFSDAISLKLQLISVLNQIAGENNPQAIAVMKQLSELYRTAQQEPEAEAMAQEAERAQLEWRKRQQLSTIDPMGGMGGPAAPIVYSQPTSSAPRSSQPADHTPPQGPIMYTSGPIEHAPNPGRQQQAPPPSLGHNVRPQGASGSSPIPSPNMGSIPSPVPHSSGGRGFPPPAGPPQNVPGRESPQQQQYSAPAAPKQAGGGSPFGHQGGGVNPFAQQGAPPSQSAPRAQASRGGPIPNPAGQQQWNPPSQPSQPPSGPPSGGLASHGAPKSYLDSVASAAQGTTQHIPWGEPSSDFDNVPNNEWFTEETKAAQGPATTASTGSGARGPAASGPSLRNMDTGGRGPSLRVPGGLRGAPMPEAPKQSFMEPIMEFFGRLAGPSTDMAGIPQAPQKRTSPVIYLAGAFVVIVAGLICAYHMLPRKLGPNQAFIAIPHKYWTADYGKRLTLLTPYQCQFMAIHDELNTSYRFYADDWRDKIDVALGAGTTKQCWIFKTPDGIRDQDGNILYLANGPEEKLAKKMELIGQYASLCYLKDNTYPTRADLNEAFDLAYDDPYSKDAEKQSGSDGKAEKQPAKQEQEPAKEAQKTKQPAEEDQESDEAAKSPSNKGDDLSSDEEEETAEVAKSAAASKAGEQKGSEKTGTKAKDSNEGDEETEAESASGKLVPNFYSIKVGDEMSAAKADKQRSELYNNLTFGGTFPVEIKATPGAINCCAVDFVNPRGSTKGFIIQALDREGKPLSGSRPGENFFLAFEDGKEKPKKDRPELPFKGQQGLRPIVVWLFLGPLDGNTVFLLKNGAAITFASIAFFSLILAVASGKGVARFVFGIFFLLSVLPAIIYAVHNKLP